jgi:hypothetical protein
LEIFTTSHHSVARSRCGGGGALLNTVQPNEFRAQTSMNIVPILSIVIVVRGTISKANLLDCDIKRAGIYICKIEAAGTPSIIPNKKKIHAHPARQHSDTENRGNAAVASAAELE